MALQTMTDLNMITINFEKYKQEKLALKNSEKTRKEQTKKEKYVIRKEETMEELEKAFPDKTVKSLQSENRSLYSSVYRLARFEGVTVKSFLESNGFSYFMNNSNSEKEKEKVIRSLKRTYPREVIYSLESISSEMKLLEKYSSDENETIVTLLNNSGFSFLEIPSYVRKFLNSKKTNECPATDKYLEKKLSLVFPSKRINKFKRNNKALFYLTLDISSKTGLSFSEFLYTLGFEYSFSKEDIAASFKLKEEAVVKLHTELTRLFPEKSVRRLSMADVSTYNLAMELAKGTDNKLRPLMLDLGFDYR